MADIFINYATEDRALAAQLAAFLHEQGYSVWWDRELIAGQQFNAAIAQALKDCKLALVIWTRSSVTSRWVLGEAETAAEMKKLVPVRADDLATYDLPTGFRALHTIPLSDQDRLAHTISGLYAMPRKAVSHWAVIRMRLSRRVAAARRRLTGGNLAITALTVSLLAAGIYLYFAYSDWRRIKDSLQSDVFGEHREKFRYSPTAWLAQSKLDGSGAWKIIKGTREKQKLEDFARSYRDSIYVEFARLRIRRLDIFEKGQYEPVLPDSAQKTYSADGIAQLFPRTDPKDCERLWRARNEIYCRLGYCFILEKGQKVFSTENCPYDDSNRINTYNHWVDDILSSSKVEYDNFVLLRRLRCDDE